MIVVKHNRDHKNTNKKYLHFVGDKKHVGIEFDELRLCAERWKIQRLLWIGHYKNQFQLMPKRSFNFLTKINIFQRKKHVTCIFHQLLKDIIKYILQFLAKDSRTCLLHAA